MFQANQPSSIVIVDDKPENLEMLTQILSFYKYQVYSALNGLIALALIRQKLPDLILLDVMMPGMDGYAVCQELKADARTRDIPVLFLSALQEILDKVKAFDVGAVDYITMPFHSKEVLARVKTHLTLGEMRKRLEAQNLQLQRKIAEHQQTEADLEESEQRYRQLVELSPDAIAIYQADRIVYVNPAGIALMGATYAEELLGKPVLDFIHPDYQTLVKERVRQSSAERKALEFFEEKFIRLDGQTLDVEVASTPILYRGAAATQVVSRDITRYKRMEAALRESERRLADIQRSSPAADPERKPSKRA